MGKKNLSSFSALLLIVPGLAGASAEGSRDISSPLRRAAANGAGNRENAETAYGKLPLGFERNRGQTDARVKFLSRGSGYTLFLTRTEAVLALKKPQKAEDAAAAGPQDEKTPNPKPENPATVLRMQLVGANTAPQVEDLDTLPGKSHYFIGSDPKKWRTNVSQYARVRYREVYPGIDLIYYGNQRRLEYDFVVSPGADPKTICLAFSGAEKLSLDDEGNLILHTEGGEVRQRAPIVYQEIEGDRRKLAGRYVLRGKREVGFQVASYDRARRLIIDPILAYSTYLGGLHSDNGFAIALDSSGNAYVTGFTYSSDFPTEGSLQDYSAEEDVFVTKLNRYGSALIYSTYIGGEDTDEGEGIAVDSSGCAYIAGWTRSAKFPTKNAFQSVHGGLADAFVAKLNADGSALVYSTYLGTTEWDEAAAIAVDKSGCAYVTGYANSGDFPTAPWPCAPKLNCPFQSSRRGGPEVFVTKFNPRGDELVYSTYLGGAIQDTAGGIALDGSGSVYVTGTTWSTDFPRVNPLQSTNAGEDDIFVTKLDDRGHSLIYSTYLGGTGRDSVSGLAVDSSGNAYVVGTISSADFPTTAGAFDTTYNGGDHDAFAAKLNPAGDGLGYSTFLGGGGADIGRGIAVSSSGNAYVIGYTDSTDFPTANAIQGDIAAYKDAFVAKLNIAGSGLLYSTYLGGGQSEYGQGIALDASGNAYVTGLTVSSDFPTAPRPFQPTYGGGGDAFVARIVDMPPGGFKILSIEATGENDIEITWTSEEGRPYRVIYQYDIALPYWYTMFTLDGTGKTITTTFEGFRKHPSVFFEIGRVE